MKISKTEIDGLLVIEPNVYNDERGYFFEYYHALRLRSAPMMGILLS